MNQIKSLIKTGIFTSLNTLGANALCRRILNHQTVVLMYHGVAKDHWTISSGDWLQVKESNFRKQMEHLKKHYDVVPIDYALRTLDRKSGKPKAVITFDDGYANNYNVAYPVLKDLQLPATVFLVTDMINTNKLFWYDRIRTSLLGNLESNKIKEIVQSYKVRHPHTIDALVDEFIRGFQLGNSQNIHNAYGILTYDQIHEMQNSGLITFDSHTHRHEILTQLNPGEPLDSIGHSLEIMRGQGIECGKIFCYPNGLYQPDHFKVLSKLGFKAATNTDCKTWNSKDFHYEIPRIGIGRDLTATQFESFASGMWKSLALLAKGVKQTILLNRGTA